MEENVITYEDFAKLDIRIGTIVAAERVPDTGKLIKCTIRFGASENGEPAERTIVSGIAEWYSPEELVGKQCPYIVNLKPRAIRGVESQGMLLAASDEEGTAILLHPDRVVEPGAKIR